MNKQRQSNFELLRIVSMILIVLHHLGYYAPSTADDPLKTGVLLLFAWGGKLGVNLFILISGYMTACSTFKSRSLLRVIFETVFFSVSILLLYLIFNPTVVDSGSNIVKSFIPCISSMYWFVTSYIGMVIVSPVLRSLLNKLNQEQLRRFLILMFVPLSLIPTFTHMDLIVNGFVWFVYLYLVAGYIRLWGVSWSRRLNFRLIFLSFAVVYLSSFAISCVCGERKMPLTAMNSIFMLCLSVCVFKAASELNIGSITFINKMAAGSFSVYLIHENWLIRKTLWPSLEPVYSSPSALLLLEGLLFACMLFAVCSLLDLIRQKFIEQPLFMLLDSSPAGRTIDCFDKWVNSIEGE